MKHTIKSITIIFCLALLMPSCEKEKNLNKNASLTSLSAERIPPDELEQAMNSFITLSLEDNPQFETYEVEDALLMIEAALNYHTATPNNGYDEIYIDSSTFNLTCNYIADEPRYDAYGDYINVIWAEVLNIARTAKERSPFEGESNPFNVVVDLEFVNPEQLLSPPTSGNQISAEVKIKTWVAHPYNLSSGNCDFGANDYWYAFPHYAPINGGCATNSTTASNSLRELNRRLSPLCRAVCYDYDYFSNINGADWGPGGLGTCANYYLWSSFSGSDCLAPSDMQCCLSGAQNGTNYYTNLISGSGNCTISLYLYDYAQPFQTPVYQQRCIASWGKPHHYTPN